MKSICDFKRNVALRWTEADPRFTLALQVPELIIPAAELVSVTYFA